MKAQEEIDSKLIEELEQLRLGEALTSSDFDLIKKKLLNPQKDKELSVELEKISLYTKKENKVDAAWWKQLMRKEVLLLFGLSLLVLPFLGSFWTAKFMLFLSSLFIKIGIFGFVSLVFYKGCIILKEVIKEDKEYRTEKEVGARNIKRKQTDLIQNTKLNEILLNDKKELSLKDKVKSFFKIKQQKEDDKSAAEMTRKETFIGIMILTLSAFLIMLVQMKASNIFAVSFFYFFVLHLWLIMVEHTVFYIDSFKNWFKKLKDL